MKYLTATCLAFILTFAGAATAFAEGQATIGEDALSPLFLKANVQQDADEVDLDSWYSSTRLPTSRKTFDLSQKMSFALQSDDNGNVSSSSNGFDSEGKNPGRALLLSAIFPGAGELYAGSPLKAALFFAIEVGCWYGAVSYAQRGNDQTTSFETYADAHWVETIYRDVEFNAANDPNAGNSFSADYGDNATRGTWNSLNWSEKIKFLPGNFTHELPDKRNQQYYENVGKYLTQFGFGWDDEFGDNPSTAYLWDGTSLRAKQYSDMRFEANNMLNLSSTFFSIIMVNHVVSALDAGFTVRAKNKRLAEVEPEVSSIWHNDNPVTVAGLRVRF